MAVYKPVGKHKNQKYTSHYLNKIMFNDDSLSLQLHDILEQNITSTYGKRSKTAKTSEAFIHYMPFQDEKPCQGQH